MKFSRVHDDKELKDILDDIISLLKETNTYDDELISYHKYGWPKEIEMNKIDVDFLESLTDNECASILIRLLFYVDMSKDNNLLSWIKFHYIEMDLLKISFDDLYFLYGILYMIDDDIILKNCKLRNYHICRFLDNFIFKIDQKYNWAVIYKFKDEDHRSYMSNDYKNDFKKIKADFNLSNSKIVRDPVIRSVLIIPHISNDDMLLLRMSLDSNHKIFSYASIKKLLDEIDSPSSQYF